MKPSTGIPFSSIVFDSKDDTPRYRQLYAYIRDMILNGSLTAGVHLPSSRELAAEIGVSRNTVIAAYELLVDEQFAESAVGRGTVVRPVPLLGRSGSPCEPTTPRDMCSAPLRMGFALPDTDHFPSPTWQKVLRAVVKRAEPAVARPPVEGIVRLRRLVSAYLGAYRGVRCREEQVLITGGGQQALYLAARVLREISGQIYIEDPGYVGARQAFEACGFELRPLPVDDDGIQPGEILHSPAGGPKAVYLTPSHQFPLGSVLSLERRLQILNWAGECGGWIIEDDYDAEYRYDGEPLTALAGLDDSERVIYVGTFSKVLSPELRLGYLVVPEALLERFRSVKGFCDGASPVLTQNAVADFIQDGYFQAHLRQMRTLYRGKRDLFLQTLRECQVPVTVQTRPHGMHITLKLDGQKRDLDIARQMMARGFEVPALSKHYLRTEQVLQGLLVGFTNAREEDCRDFAENLLEIMECTES
ncbi:PLP-dependent aminotransferase family protein [Microbulbifer rhizosphaerae]|uniref:GntR family transcriptional regulator/MocR family aminotransferase n=1 Tax=Microbulbifer rhizosphaerae TaxID=1562603 RepID=A0A7W4ZBP8_9GAMM|nr:PLP-dependent aminotransferase family protein [Microbulbifer rhizosphaerae]MBB3062530.1 GntR family transcriptional regulator/MocR family aminotransferase [Microbulbifer rhizosphaerae]